jgi:CheY-like chemotaxis protein
MDLRMPEIDGLEATRRIRDKEGGAEVKIAALTASASEGDRDQVMAGGFDDFVRKPFHNSQVFNCMSRHLGVRYGKTSNRPKPNSQVAVTAEALASLPANLHEELRSAVIALDVKQVKEVVRKIGAHDAALSAALSHMADGFAYTAILNALDGDQAAPASPA